jgi:hypothetical protein
MINKELNDFLRRRGKDQSVNFLLQLIQRASRKFFERRGLRGEIRGV